MKRNNKGYMLVELVLAAIIAAAITAYLITMTIKLKNKNDDLLVETQVITDTSIASNKLQQIINKDPNNFDCGKIKVEDNIIKYDNEIVTIFNKYAVLTPSTSYCNDNGIDNSAQLHINVDVPQIPDRDFDINIDYIKRKASSPNALFEGIGHYGFAIAGNNNATHGTSYSRACTTTEWIYDEPIAQVKKTSLADAKRTYRITNISGSRLNVPSGGKIKKAIFSYFAYGNGEKGCNQTKFNGTILMIRPDGVRKNIRYDNKGWGWAEYLDITELLDRNNPDGWYYISFINSHLAPQVAWSMTVVYEANTAPYSDTRLILNEKQIGYGGTALVNFDSENTPKGKYQITGTILGGGMGAWPVGDNANKTKDRVFIVREGASDFQLYDRGDGKFTGRTNTDFARDIFSTERTHGNDKSGGELDIFNEMLDINYLGGHKLKGVKFIKDGDNGIVVGLVGISMEIENPKS